MPVVGTAGHVDHGKSTLVQALTGRNPDRWEEERQRGLTIDLGFAWTELPGGVEAGFVDVPGHERFIKNMLAGVDGIDVALFVVAADEGWMPQSEEHLAVLDLLGVSRGVVALTRVDLVDDDLAELATLEVQERLTGTSLEHVPVLPVASPSGEGVDEIRQALADAIGAAPEAAGRRPRLWVDRSFVIQGAGTVVTGTLTGGALEVGDQVTIWPGALESRVRSLQTHEQSRDRAEPGTRTAVNVVGLERNEIARGAMVGYGADWRETSRLLVSLRTVRSHSEPITGRGAYHLHVGSGAWPVRLRILEQADHEDGTALALLRLEQPLPLQMGDRFILRDTGRRAVVAGGRTLDPHPPRRGSAARHAAPSLRQALAGTPNEQADALLIVRGQDTLANLAADSGGGRPDALAVDGTAVSHAEFERLGEAAAAAIADFHDANPLRPGVPKATLAAQLRIPPALLERVVAGHPGLVDEAATVRSSTFSGSWNEADEARWSEARATLAAAGLAVPRSGELSLPAELFHAALREGRLVKIDADLVYLPEQIAEIEGRLGELADEFTVAEFRDLMAVTRRHAVPLLEWLDRSGKTARDGDVRRVRRPRRDEPVRPADPPR